MTRASTLIRGSASSPTSCTTGEQCAQHDEIDGSVSDAVSANFRIKTSSTSWSVLQYQIWPEFLAVGVWVNNSTMYSPLSVTLLVALYSIGWNVAISVVLQSATANGSRLTGRIGRHTEYAA